MQKEKFLISAYSDDRCVGLVSPGRRKTHRHGLCPKFRLGFSIQMRSVTNPRDSWNRKRAFGGCIDDELLLVNPRPIAQLREIRRPEFPFGRGIEFSGACVRTGSKTRCDQPSPRRLLLLGLPFLRPFPELFGELLLRCSSCDGRKPNRACVSRWLYDGVVR